MLLNLFGAPQIPYESFKDFEAESPNLIIYAAPAMIIIAIVEIVVAWLTHRHMHEKKETLGSFMVGIGNVIINFLLKSFLFLPVLLIYNLVPWRMEFSWWTFLPCYILFDFASYVAHFVSHQCRFWWATHVVHHSGEHYNLTVSFRLSWVQNIKIIFFVPVMFMGFHPVIFFIVSQVAVLFQFWVHTEYIRKMPRWVEYIFATPSNHRVHHGSQEQYIDRNYGATFILWDRIFGTYEPEGEKVRYGITTNIEHKANPLYINFHEYADIVRDVRSTRSWRKKLFYIFGSPIAIDRHKKAQMKKLQQQLSPAEFEAFVMSGASPAPASLTA